MAKEELIRNGAALSAHLDEAHVGDIKGALGTIRLDAERPATRRRRLLALCAVLGPGLIVMVGDNDAGGVSTYAQAGQDYGVGLLWTILLLVPVLIVNQEMVVRLGAVTGVGHARLILERFGKFWGAFSVGDLFVLNFLTIVTEFIGVSQVARYFGIPSLIAVPATAVALIAMTVTGSFRRWERFMFVFIAFNFLAVPLALTSHPHPVQAASGFVPQLPGGLSSGLLLLIIAIVGTTVAPWQLFFQQSNVIDKRITPRWLSYERMDVYIGSGVVALGAIALIVATAFAFRGTPAAGAFVDAGTTATQLARHLGPIPGALFALLLLNASLIGASAVTLSTSYAFGDVFNRRHSLHWHFGQAPTFYVIFTGLVAVAAAIVLVPNAPLGLINLGVQALAGVLLPSASVFLLLLCNDRAVLGPWVNQTWLNVAASVIIGVLVVLSLILGVTTVLPGLDVARVTALSFGAMIAVLIVVGVLQIRIVVGVLQIRIVVGVLQIRARKGSAGGRVKAIPEAEEVDRLTWRMPPLASLRRPDWSLARKAGILTLRAYLVLMVLLVVGKIVSMVVSGAHHA